MKRGFTYKYIDDYLKYLLSQGRYSVTLRELIAHFNISEKAILQNIYRLKSKKQLAQVRKEFYVIVPPQYSKRGMIPPTLFINDLMAFLEREYYVALYSAAALHGAGHQQPMSFQLITQKPALRDINNAKLNIHFFIKHGWEKDQIIQKKTEAGFLNVSSPGLTAFDLVQHHKKIGGINRIIPILEDLTDSIKVSQLTKIAKTQKKANIQRLGYLFDRIDKPNLSEALLRMLKGKAVTIPLSLSHQSRTGLLNSKWSIILNTELES